MGRRSKKSRSLTKSEKEDPVCHDFRPVGGSKVVTSISSELSQENDEKTEGKTKQHSVESKAKLLYDLGFRYEDLGKWLNAADAFEKSMNFYNRLGNKEKVTEVEIHLGECLLNQGKIDKAKNIFQKYVKACPEKWNHEAIAAAYALGGLGQIEMKFGKFLEAEAYLKMSLSLWKGMEKSERVGFTRNLISMVYMNLGNFAEAEEHIKEALKIYKSLPQKHEELKFTVKDANVTLHNNLAEIYRKTKRFGMAEDHCRKTLKYYESLPDKLYRENVATTLNNFGRLYFDQGKLGEAEEQWNKAMKIAMAEAYQVKIAEISNNFGLMYMQQDKPDEAQEKFEGALNIFRSQLGEKHERVYQTQALLKNLALFSTLPY